MRPRLIALSIVALLFLSAHTAPGSLCEGAFGFNHGISSDGGGWYHNLDRYPNTAGNYTAIRNHYTYSITGYIWQHRTVRNGCGELGGTHL